MVPQVFDFLMCKCGVFKTPETVSAPVIKHDQRQFKEERIILADGPRDNLHGRMAIQQQTATMAVRTGS